MSFEDWARLGSRDVAEVLTEVEVWRKLDDTWQWANQEEEPGEDAWACFLDGLREDLEPLRDELQAQAAEVAAGQERFDAAATLGLWPLEYAGQSRAVHAEALDAIAERMGIPRSEMLDVESIEDEPLFVLSDEAHAIEALADALAARIAWARASHRLSLPRSAAPVVDG